MEKRLFVGNIPFSMTSDDLRVLFEPFGEIVEAYVVVNRMTNRPKGIGFVEFAQSEQAKSAIDALNETEQGGRKIIVAFARPKPEESNQSASPEITSSETQPETNTPDVDSQTASDTPAAEEVAPVVDESVTQEEAPSESPEEVQPQAAETDEKN